MTIPTNRDSDKFVLRLPDGMRDRIKLAAEVSGRSMNQEIIQALEEKFPAMIGTTAYMRANAETVAREKYEVEDVDIHSSELPIRPPVGAGNMIDPRGFVRSSDGIVFMKVVCLP